MTTFTTDWSTGLVVSSVLATLVLLLCAGLAGSRTRLKPMWRISVTLIPLLIVFSAVIGTITGYTLDGVRLQVVQLGKTQDISLQDLIKVEFAPHKTNSKTRALGNGGLFAYTGRYRSRVIGEFRAFVTNWEDAVILYFSDRVIVVSPSDPAAFVKKLAPLSLSETD